MDSGKELTRLLEEAADGKPGAVAAFFGRLLESTVWVPLKGDSETAVSSGVGLVGETKLAQLGYVTVEYEGKETLPIFTEEAFVAEWAEREIFSEAKELKSLLWVVGDDVWLYLNPAQEVGKEITDWEIERLRRGVEAIPELVSELDDDGTLEISVRWGAELYPELKQKLLPILEIYPELREAFLVAVKDSDEGDEKPTLGIKFAKITEAKRLYLRSELEVLSKDYLPAHERLIIFDDLGDKASPNANIFSDATPFYIAQESVPKGETGIRSILSHLKPKGRQ